MLGEKEISVLLTDLIEVYGYDFTGYSQSMLARRVNRLYKLRAFSGFAAFRYLLTTDPEYFRWFIAELTVPVTEMFRDPSFFLLLRKEILPALSDMPLIRIWHAGCATGEEVYSVAILLKELNLLHKSLLYATDLNPVSLEKASAGIFPLNGMKLYSANYNQAGGRADFSDFYTANYDLAKFNEQLKSRMVFSTHNLVKDVSFNHFQLIICRNVLIYFGHTLQNHVLSLFNSSLETHGYLALGSKETLRFSDLNPFYKQIHSPEKIWQKI